MNEFQGDVKLTISPFSDGGINYVDGQPEFDTGIENSVIISIGTIPGWWGNLLTDDPNKKIGSVYADDQGDFINNSYLRRKEAEAVAALQWQIKTGLSEKIESEITNPQADRLENKITATRPGGIQEEFFINWEQQQLKGVS